MTKISVLQIVVALILDVYIQDFLMMITMPVPLILVAQLTVFNTIIYLAMIITLALLMIVTLHLAALTNLLSVMIRMHVHLTLVMKNLVVNILILLAMIKTHVL
jgi:hypothetical protein